MNKYCFSTAYDVGLLSIKCLENSLFRKIVSTEEYTAEIYDLYYFRYIKK